MRNNTAKATFKVSYGEKLEVMISHQSIWITKLLGNKNSRDGEILMPMEIFKQISKFVQEVNNE